jgi:acyl-coenzyme A thioesterase PaaI-like protein
VTADPGRIKTYQCAPAQETAGCGVPATHARQRDLSALRAPLRPVTFDVVADARVVRIGRSTSFGRVMLYSAVDKRPVGMVASAFVTQ